MECALCLMQRLWPSSRLLSAPMCRHKVSLNVSIGIALNMLGTCTDALTCTDAGRSCFVSTFQYSYDLRRLLSLTYM